MDVQYISDLHLEFHDKHDSGSINPEMFLTPVAPYLVLAGDIGIPHLKAYGAFLHWCSQRWKHVFLIAGNHEYYNVRCLIKTDMETKKQQIRAVCKPFSNVHFLDCDSFYVPETNVRVLGCTLWTEIPDCIKDKVITYMNDTRQILYEKEVPFFPPTQTQIHEQQKQWLHQEIHKCELTNERCLIITHHLPSYSLIHEKYKGNPLNACFASDCEDLFRPPVKGWICGHTHTGMKIQIHGIPCVVNPQGYPHETVETRDRTAVLKI